MSNQQPTMMSNFQGGQPNYNQVNPNYVQMGGQGGPMNPMMGPTQGGQMMGPMMGYPQGGAQMMNPMMPGANQGGPMLMGPNQGAPMKPMMMGPNQGGPMMMGPNQGGPMNPMMMGAYQGGPMNPMMTPQGQQRIQAGNAVYPIIQTTEAVGLLNNKNFLDKLESLQYVMIEDVTGCCDCGNHFVVQSAGNDLRPAPPVHFDMSQEICCLCCPTYNYKILEGASVTGRWVDESCCCARFPAMHKYFDQPSRVVDALGRTLARNNRPKNCCPQCADGVSVQRPDGLGTFWVGTICICCPLFCYCCHICPKCCCMCTCCCKCQCCPDSVWTSGLFNHSKSESFPLIFQIATCQRNCCEVLKCGRLYFVIRFPPQMTKEDKLATITGTLKYYELYERFPEEEFFYIEIKI